MHIRARQMLTINTIGKLNQLQKLLHTRCNWRIHYALGKGDDNKMDRQNANLFKFRNKMIIIWIPIVTECNHMILAIKVNGHKIAKKGYTLACNKEKKKQKQIPWWERRVIIEKKKNDKEPCLRIIASLIRELGSRSIANTRPHIRT